MRVLIDGDPIVYRAGFASQNNWKILQWTDVVDEDDIESDIDREAFFAYVADMKDFIEEEGLHPDEYQHHIWVDPLSEQFCLNIVKTSLQNTVDAIEGYLAETDQKVESVEVYLSGSTNFRNGLATIPGKFTKEGDAVLGYKANRKDTIRPYWYKRIRDYMVEVWNARIFEGIEADDALAIEQWAEDEYAPTTVIATIDKDLMNVPGWHYNILKKEDIHVSFKQAQVHFYRQCLTGDPTDNIPGLYRVGKGKAEKLINENMTEDQMYEVCLAEYITNIEKFPQRHGPYVDTPGCSPAGAAGALLENARLLWMLQYPDQLWTAPGEPDASIAEAHLFDNEEWD